MLLSCLLFGAAAAVPCSMSGEMRDGRCVCDAGFRGPDCAALDFDLPEAAQAGLNPIFGQEVEGGAKQWSWGGSPLRAPDGLYHLFFSWFPFSKGTNHTIKNWFNTSVVAHAVSDRPTGNFTFTGMALPPRGGDFFDGTTTHNPTVIQLPDGTYALYYIGLNCAKFEDCIKHQWIGAAHAKDLNGPWQRLDKPVLSGEDGQSWEGGMVANPAVVVLVNGTLLMGYRGLGDRGIGMAEADAWNGPFRRLNNGSAVLGPESPLHTAVDEDMVIWRTSRGLQMLLHQEGRGDAVGTHAYSTDDGASWTIAGDAYNLSVTLDSQGDRVDYLRRERPQLLKSASGQPTHLFNGVQDADGYTHTVVVPLRGAHAHAKAVLV